MKEIIKSISFMLYMLSWHQRSCRMQ